MFTLNDFGIELISISYFGKNMFTTSFATSFVKKFKSPKYCIFGETRRTDTTYFIFERIPMHLGVVTLERLEIANEEYNVDGCLHFEWFRNQNHSAFELSKSHQGRILIN